MKFLVCICTKNREESVIRLVDSIKDTNFKNVRLLIADSTEPETRFKEFDKALNNIENLEIEHFYVKGGLPTARNACIINLNTDEIVIFFDDDVTIPRDFFNQISNEIISTTDFAAAGVRISGLYKQQGSLWNFLGNKIRSRNYGKVTRFGENIWFPDANFHSKEAEWIPGCCMIFNPEVLRQFEFNEFLENGPGRNYALGEDMDFTLRLSDKHKIVAIGTTYVNHHYAPSKRDDELLIAGATGSLFGYLLNVFPSRFSKKLMILGVIAKYSWATKFVNPSRFFRMMFTFLNHLNAELKTRSLEGKSH